MSNGLVASEENMKLVTFATAVLVVFVGCVAVGCGDLAVYEGADTERDAVTADGVVADARGGDTREGDAAADGETDGASDATGDAVNDSGTDSGTDVVADVVQDGGVLDVAEASVDTNTGCPPDEIVCVTGGPCMPFSATNSSCGYCGTVCAGPFTCMNTYVPDPHYVQCCYAIDQSRSCESQCPAPGGCSRAGTTGNWFCCQ